jgi:hypothetical protein
MVHTDHSNRLLKVVEWSACETNDCCWFVIKRFSQCLCSMVHRKLALYVICVDQQVVSWRQLEYRRIRRWDLQVRTCLTGRTAAAHTAANTTTIATKPMTMTTTPSTSTTGSNVTRTTRTVE